jgi:ribosomal protein S18 acetylase RimI-like enzyme
MTRDLDTLVRRGRQTDLPALVPLSGSADRAYWRVKASDADEEGLLVVEYGEQLIAAVSVRWDGTCDPPFPWLYGLHVRHDVRRHGVGALLVKAAETLAGLRGLSAMSLDVDRDEDELVTYYRRLGYQRIAPHQHHWRSVDPSTGLVTAEGNVDTWVMRHELGSRG